ncbi:exosome non-catalytic core subunit rrp46 [Saitozyma podzolica]|uniref:Exosome non-catalytic core subunit rrp46 n=1 Tax=Saitozyma podzolica TaxID=1890683 RepID=A0A427YGC7_9TREE|nr:exosome non-catalytic core subunit rrp46 [Saitozyma podzolica]
MSSSRHDRRAPTELRPLSVTVGQLARADGSGRFAFGELPTLPAPWLAKLIALGSTAAVASLNGPIEVRLREELPDRATLEVIHRPLEGVGATSSRALESSLSALLIPLLNLSQHPRSLIQLVVQSLSSTTAPSFSDSTIDFPESSSQKSWPPSETVLSSHTAPASGIPFSSRAASINAAALAALDAGSVAMRGVPIGVALAYIPAESGEEAGLVLDPTPEEEARATSRYGFGWAFGVGLSATPHGGMDMDGEEGEAELVWVESEGQFTRSEFQEALDLSRSAARQIHGFVREQLKQRFNEVKR